MTARSKDLARILKVQDGIKRMADWRLAEADRERADVAEAQRALAAFIDGGALTGLLATAAIGQGKRLAEREVLAERRREAEAEAVRDATARQKLIGRRVETLRTEERAAQERKDLERLIEGFVGRSGAGEEA